VDFSGILLTGTTIEEASCKSKFVYANMNNDARCGASGFFLQLGATGALGWWICISFHTYTMIRNSMKQTYFEHYEKYFHGIVWTYGSSFSLS
jgi:hypothetical protein